MAQQTTPRATSQSPHHTATNLTIKTMLRLMALNFNLRPSLSKYLRHRDGWFDFKVGIQTDNKSVDTGVIVSKGKIRVARSVPADCQIKLIFASDDAVKKLLRATPTEQVFMLMKGQLRTQGNAAYMGLFFFLLSLLLHKKQKKQMNQERELNAKAAAESASAAGESLRQEMTRRRAYRMKAPSVDPGVKCLNDPYLSEYGLDDFPRIKTFLDVHLSTKAEICPERPALLTEWYRQYGFEQEQDGRPWNPVLRQALAFKYLMENRRPIIGRNDLIAGTTTAKDVGVVVYPDSHSLMIWPELLTVAKRNLNPYDVAPSTIELLHKDIFPFWMQRNFREWVRQEYESPLCQAIDERFAVYFIWKQAALSHTIPDFPKIMGMGTAGMIAEIKARLESGSLEQDQRTTLEAMILTLEGLAAYSRNLSAQAAKEAAAATDPARKEELENLAVVCARVVEHPARNLDEAVNAMWITWVGLHMENTNAGLSLGRLDQWLQPYFEQDMAAISSEQERREYIHHAIELVACFMMRCTDHLPLTPDLANWYFGGSSSDQAITLGGIKPGGGDAVNDMTYIFLKVTEMLSIRDPNVNARFHNGINSDTYLKRLCEVNLITAGTPSMHNDEAIFASLAEFEYAPEDLRDWSATGCVEPTLSGKHIGHTNFQMLNMVAALEMALNDGLHPVMNWKLGPATGEVKANAFKSFEEFFEAFTRQFKFLIDNSVEYNNMLGLAHQAIRPTPLLSAFIADCPFNGIDVTHGGARYNSSGAACIGLADVTDSLMVIKKLVFDENKVSFAELKKAIDGNFADDPVLHALVTRKVAMFGSGSEEAVEMANRVTKFAHDTYGSHRNYRGGPYTVGFWSMSNHVIYGNLTGALPSGRLAGKPFTPGLTPQPGASKSLLDNIRDVARLDARNMNNNIAFNVKVVPGPNESREQAVDNIYSYVKTFFDLGGMQMQMNVVSSETLRDAMAHPENYRNLIVRISGYNAYFVTLNRDMQLELIERAEYAA